MPSLPVLSASSVASPADLMRRFHRSQLLLARTVADEVPLAGGAWLRNPDLQPAAGANCVLEAAVSPGEDPAAVVAAAVAESADCPIRAWTLNPSLPSDRTAPLADHLARTGWVTAASDVLHLPRLRPAAGPAPSGLTVLPVRAALGPYRQLLAGRYRWPVEVELSLLRLDDAHLDAWVALREGQAIASASLLNDGDAGTVTDLYVAPSDRGRGVGQHLLRRAVDASGRAGHRTLLAESTGVGPFAAVGFDSVGRWVRWVRPAESGGLT